MWDTQQGFPPCSGKQTLQGAGNAVRSVGQKNCSFVLFFPAWNMGGKKMYEQTEREGGRDILVLLFV